MRPGVASIGAQALRQRLARLGRVHAMDHPVLAPGVKQGVAAAHPLAVEAQHDLASLPLLGRVRAAVPDPHPPAAVLALGDVAGEVEVLERVVLRVDREPVAVGVPRHAARERPRRQHPVVLEPQVPVQARRVVLLDDEAAGFAVRVVRRSSFVVRLGRLIEVALGAVVGELVACRRHCCLCTRFDERQGVRRDRDRRRPRGRGRCRARGERGLETAIVEQELIGGECSFYACMPSKALLRPGELHRRDPARAGRARARRRRARPGVVLARRDEVIHDLDDGGMIPWLEDRGDRAPAAAARALDGERT